MKISKLPDLKIEFMLFCLFLVSMVANAGTFSKLSFFKIGELPIYITEFAVALIIFIFSSYFLLLRKYKIISFPYLSLEFILFWIFALFALIKGLIIYDDKIFVLRQSAIVYYSIFYFLAFYIVKEISQLKILLLSLLTVISIVTLLELAGVKLLKFITYNYFYSGLLISFCLAYMPVMLKSRYKWLFIALIVVQLIAFFRAQVRATWIGLAVTAIFAVFLMVKIPAIRSKLLLSFKISSMILLLSAILIAAFKPKLLSRIRDEASSIFMISAGDMESNLSVNNSKWRLYTWRDMLVESIEKPLLGWGFGKKFIPPTIVRLNWGGSWKDKDKLFQDPHNSYLNILHSLGLLGLIIFLAIILKFITKIVKFIKNANNDDEIIYMILGFLFSMIYILVASFFMVVLEGPYYGIFLWISMGLIMCLYRIYTSKYDRQ